MNKRQFWIDQIESLWLEKNIIWLKGVRRSGKTTVCKSHKKFKDSLTDRKREQWLTPINVKDFKAFDHLELEDRLFKGGFPAVCNQSKFDENYFSDWIDSYWAKDIQEQFSIRKRDSFIKFFELLCLQSGSMFEAKLFSSPCAVSHNTINSFLDVLELTRIAIKLRPFFKNKSKEIISAPKVYFFDTGFISYFSGAQKMISEQLGNFFEHFVLNEFISLLKVKYS